MTGGYGMPQSSPPVTTKIYPSASISQPPSAQASPVSGHPGMAMPHSYSSSGFAGDPYYGLGDDPMLDARGWCIEVDQPPGHLSGVPTTFWIETRMLAWAVLAGTGGGSIRKFCC
ncbi:uncharacterized protein CEXT_106131 [Caerostris extrusa]|uniref:Uncharacterized protein n=1 Tax=Caerostris extrusa TaxID=172846 RepID=A0AAV4QLC2_CAEEX|nr:uncharacterized protein CEXT_106131 [Caerostris extrusa]